MDYLSKYGFDAAPAAPVRKFQGGGPVPQGAPAGPPPEGGGGDMQAQLMAVVESQDPQMALAFVNQLAEQMAASQGPPAGPEGAPAGPPVAMGGGQAPMYKRGGKVGVFSKSESGVSFSRK